MTTPNPSGSGAYVDPPIEDPPQMDAAMLGEWTNEDTYDGYGAAGQTYNWRTFQQAAGYAHVKVTIAAGDTVSRGLLQSTIVRNPLGGESGWRRMDVWGVAIDGYAASPETWVWSRFRMVSAVPTAADDYYVSPFGVAEEAVNVQEPTEGMGLVYDQTVGVQSWVWRCWRAGVALDLDLNEPFDALFHICGACHRGANGIEVFWDGVSKGILNGVEIQPADEVQPYHSHLVQIAAAMVFNPVMISDLYGWGSPGV